MLVPVIVRANFKVTTSQDVVLETIAGQNLPLLFASLQVLNRTGATSTITTEVEKSNSFAGQTDPDFNGTVLTQVGVSQSIGNGQSRTYDLGTLMPSGYGVSNTLSLANAGPAVEARVSLVLTGMIETSVQPDPAVIRNV